MQATLPTLRRWSSRSARALLPAVVAVVAVVLVLGVAPAGAAPAAARTTGFPTSSNGASSMYLAWENGAGTLPEVSAVIEILRPPAVSSLYFWALQVDFVDDAGARVGSAHLGLQWDPSRPGSTGVNFGGYGGSTTAAQLEGSESGLPSANNDRNTRDYPWQAGHRYRLRIYPAGDGWWNGAVTDLDTGTTDVVRKLRSGGTALARPLVFSEVFARCDAPGVTVRWSRLAPAPSGVRAGYQSYNAGGCSNTSAESTGRGVVQRTNTERRVRDYEVLRSTW